MNQKVTTQVFLTIMDDFTTRLLCDASVLTAFWIYSEDLFSMWRNRSKRWDERLFSTSASIKCICFKADFVNTTDSS